MGDFPYIELCHVSISCLRFFCLIAQDVENGGAGLNRFNLMLEILLLDRKVSVFARRYDKQCFNLMLEILLLDRKLYVEGGRWIYGVSISCLRFFCLIDSVYFVSRFGDELFQSHA